MRVLVVPNLSKENAVEITLGVIAALHQCGAQVLLEPSVQAAFVHTEAKIVKDAMAQCDAIVTVGGDGTILHMARRCATQQRPLLGVNLGRVGFLATMEPEETEKLQRLVAGAYTLDHRPLLNVYVEGQTPFKQFAMNEVVIAKTLVSQTIEVKIYCDDILVNEYWGDGVILATPTGSTAYSLSAGGPVLDARIHGLVVTPICAHSMHSPPMVFSAQRKLRVRIGGRAACRAQVSCDGLEDVCISGQDTIEVAYSDICVPLITFGEASQFEAIDKKLKGR